MPTNAQAKQCSLQQHAAHGHNSLYLPTRSVACPDIVADGLRRFVCLPMSFITVTRTQSKTDINPQNAVSEHPLHPVTGLQRRTTT